MERMRSVAKATLLTLAVVSLMLTSGVKGVASAAEPIKIGAIVSVTGPGGMIGTPMRDAFVALVEDFNRKGGVQGRQIQLFVEDDQSNPTNAVVSATKLVRDMNVALLMGPTISDSAMAMIPVAEQEQIPFAITGPVIIPFKKWVFQVTPSDLLTLAYMVEYAVDNLKAKKIAILHNTGVFGMTGWKVAQSEIKNYPGASIVIEEKFDMPDTNMIPQLTRIKAANPDIILCQSDGASSGVIAKNYKQLGMKTPVLAPPSVATPDFFRIGGAIAEESKWIFMTARITVGEQMPPGDTWRKTLYEPFKKIMQEKYGPRPLNVFHSVAHDDMKVVIEALQAAGSDDRATIRDTLEKTRYVGLNGSYSYSPTDHRGISKWFGSIAILKNGAFVPYEQ